MGFFLKASETQKLSQILTTINLEDGIATE